MDILDTPSLICYKFYMSWLDEARIRQFWSVSSLVRRLMDGVKSGHLAILLAGGLGVEGIFITNDEKNAVQFSAERHFFFKQTWVSNLLQHPTIKETQ